VITGDCQRKSESRRAAAERRFKSLGCGKRFENGRHHVDLRRLVVGFVIVVVVVAIVTQTLRLVPDDRIVEQVEVGSGKLADQLHCVALVSVQLLGYRRYLYH